MHHVPWYTPLHTLYVLVHTTTQLLCLDTHLTCLGTHYYTHHIPLYTPQHTHLICWCTSLRTLYALVHTNTNLNMPLYIPIKTLCILLHTTTPVTCLGYTIINSTLHCVQLHPPLCSLNKSNSIRLTKLKRAVLVVGVLTYINTKLQVSMIRSYITNSKFAENAELHRTWHYI